MGMVDFVVCVEVYVGITSMLYAHSLAWKGAPLSFVVSINRDSDTSQSLSVHGNFVLLMENGCEML